MLVAATVPLGLLPVVGCSKESARGSEEDDRAKLAMLLGADAKVDAVLSEADRLDRQGKPAEAAKLVDGEATSALSDAKALLGRTTADTPWGKEQRAELDKLLADRTAAMPAYSAALRGTDPKAKLEALVIQVGLEKRALGIAASMKAKTKVIDKDRP